MTVAGAGVAHSGAVAVLLDRLCDMLVEAEPEFNALDRAIGDGDHGANLARAARNLASKRHELAAQSPGEALILAGRTVVMSTGGASGPLYGTLLMDMGKALGADPGAGEWARAFTAGVEALARRGRSQEGDKTMLDVLAPAARAFSEQAGRGWGDALDHMRAAADEGLTVHRGLRARRGRAAYVGERSEGADDPGAVSAHRCLVTVIEFLRSQQQ